MSCECLSRCQAARGDVFKFRGQAMIGERVAAEAEFAAMVVEHPR